MYCHIHHCHLQHCGCSSQNGVSNDEESIKSIYSNTEELFNTLKDKILDVAYDVNVQEINENMDIIRQQVESNRLDIELINIKLSELDK